jgi:hypothetical protein
VSPASSSGKRRPQRKRQHQWASPWSRRCITSMCMKRSCASAAPIHSSFQASNTAGESASRSAIRRHVVWRTVGAHPCSCERIEMYAAGAQPPHKGSSSGLSRGSRAQHIARLEEYEAGGSCWILLQQGAQAARCYTHSAASPSRRAGSSGPRNPRVKPEGRQVRGQASPRMTFIGRVLLVFEPQLRHAGISLSVHNVCRRRMTAAAGCALVRVPRR